VSTRWKEAIEQLLRMSIGREFQMHGVIVRAHAWSNVQKMLLTGWPLVWKTWKCQGIWNMSGKCQGKYLVREKCPKTVHY